MITARTQLEPTRTYTLHPCRSGVHQHDWDLHIHYTHAAKKKEFKHKDNGIKGRQPPSEVTEILIEFFYY
jgi:hypothetical protein